MYDIHLEALALQVFQSGKLESAKCQSNKGVMTYIEFAAVGHSLRDAGTHCNL